MLEQTLIGRVRVKGAGLDPLLASSRLTQLLKNLELRPSRLPPSALLCVRRLKDPRPCTLRIDNVFASPPDAWAFAVNDRLSELANQAARPAREPVPPGAEAVVFLDWSELLACLASDWSQGVAHSRWWWQSVLKQGLSREIVKEFWERTAQYIPAALQHLAIKQQAVSFVRNFSDAEVHELWRAVAKMFALTSLVPPRDESTFQRDALNTREPGRETTDSGSEPQGQLETETQPLETETQPPWAPWVPEVEDVLLSPAQAFFLGMTLMLQRAPAKVRATNFQIEVRRWVNAITAPVAERYVVREDVAVAPPAKRVRQLSAPQPSDKLPVTHAGNALADEKRLPLQSDSEIHQSRAADQFDATEPIAVQTSEAPSQSYSDQKHDAKSEPAGKIKKIAEVLAVAEPGAVNTEMLLSDAPSESTEQQNVAELSEATRAPGEIVSETGELVAASPEPIPTPAFEIQETETNEEWTETKLGGLFYLINLALFLGLYGDFTSPNEPGLELSIWEFIRLIGKDLLWQKPAGQQGLVDCQPSSTRNVPLGALPDSRASAPASLQKPARQQGLERQPSSTRYVPLGTLPDSRASAPALNYEDDPLWELLARLGQREDEAEAGCGFEPADEWRISPDWLQPFAQESSKPWLWSASAERLRLFHPAGFAVLDLPRSPAEESPAAQLERELRAYASFEIRVSRFELIEQPNQPELQNRNSKLETWLSRLLPYLRARLRKALGLTETAEPGPLLCRQRAQVCITPTHVDLFFRLADLPIEIRRSGLDRDPGWVPAAGRFIAFHFE